jgi:AsmA family/AsmA-like C-terminal region
LNFLRSRRGKAVAGIVLVLVLFLVRPGAQRLRTRIVRSISLALGRQVDVGSVSVRLLPQPGFDLENFVVHDDPAFGAEPVLQSADVVALIRLSSLLRGRLEIARLSLTEPSLNLVHDREGRWNLESLLERAARTPVAPTAKARTEIRPGFPYIEAEHGRINFKSGPEKKAYALTEANFAVWQDSENAWGMRLKAQPMRTDFNLSDTGVLEVEGSWQRAENLHETPVQFTAQWDGAQLGQVTKLTWGQDKGWRGAIRVSAKFSGSPNDLNLNADASIDDFRRYDIAADKALRLAARCSGHYSSVDHVLSQVGCLAPVGEGGITVNGRIAVLSPARNYDLTLLAQNLPIQPLVELARRVKKNVPSDMIAAGKLDAKITLSGETNATGSRPVWHGGGELLALNVRSPLNNTRLVVDKIPFTVSSNSGLDGHASAPGRATVVRLASEPRVDIGPFNLSLGRPANATVHGQVNRSGYNLVVQGDAEIQRLFAVARTVGLPASQLPANGDARINLRIAGGWAGFAPPTLTGTAALNSIQARVRGLSKPVEILSANISLTPDKTEVEKLTVLAAGNTWRGTLAIPRRCDAPHACSIRFDLHADEIATDQLGVANLAPGQQPWYRFLASPVQSSSSSLPRPYLATVHAIGKLTAGRILIHGLVASHVSTEAELDQGRLRLSNLRAEVLGGRHSGEWTADFTVNPPAYSGTGTLEKVVLGQLAEAMHDDWISGSANVAYRGNTSGWSKAELLANADASLQIEGRDGLLPHLALAGESAPLHINRFAGRLFFRDGKFEIAQGKLQTPVSIYQFSGTASLSRDLDIKLMRDGTHAFNITGTLTQPHVAINTSPETQAALKP